MKYRTKSSILLGLVAAYLHGQAAPAGRLEFDAASIRPGGGRPATMPNVMLGGTQGGPGTADPERFTGNRVNLSSLLSRAYDVTAYRLSAPAWAGTARFDIAAKVPAGASKEQFNVMLQNLLADRFGLRAHFQPKEFTTYQLAVSARGTKLEDSQMKYDDEKHITSIRTTPDGVRVVAHSFTVGWQNGRIVAAGGKTKMDPLVRLLSEELGGPVTDATGLTGEYDIVLQFSGDGLPGKIANQPHSNSGAGDAASEPVPNLSQALEQQLGLRLEKSKTMLDVLVVDHLEQTPTEN